MEKIDVIKNIGTRTGGDIYLGVVGAVRTGKSTFIKKFMELLVLPNIDNEYKKERAIDELSSAIINENKRYQVLLGATGTGKTFTISNVIKNVNKPTIVMAHNKTLAGQLYAELKEFFPNNRVEYFISNFDFYQPEAYLPKTDTYIDKNALTNQEIEMMRSSAINSLIERKDTIVVASVAAIYGLGDPSEYSALVFNVVKGETIDRKEFLAKL